MNWLPMTDEAKQGARLIAGGDVLTDNETFPEWRAFLGVTIAQYDHRKAEWRGNNAGGHDALNGDIDANNYTVASYLERAAKEIEALQSPHQPTASSETEFLDRLKATIKPATPPRPDREALRKALIASKCTSPDGTMIHEATEKVLDLLTEPAREGP